MGKTGKQLLGCRLIFKWLSGFNSAFLLHFIKAGSPEIEMWLILTQRRALLRLPSPRNHWHMSSVYGIALSPRSVDWRLLIWGITWNKICSFFFAPRKSLLCQETKIEDSLTLQIEK